jgi:hypothetical protein
MVNARRWEKEDDDEDEEEFDANGIPRIDPARFSADRRNQRPPAEGKPLRERRQTPVGNAGGNTSNNTGDNNGGNADTEGSHNQQIVTLEIPLATWDKAKDALAGRCLMGAGPRRTRGKQYLLHM